MELKLTINGRMNRTRVDDNDKYYLQSNRTFSDNTRSFERNKKIGRSSVSFPVKDTVLK